MEHAAAIENVGQKLDQGMTQMKGIMHEGFSATLEGLSDSKKKEDMLLEGQKKTDETLLRTHNNTLDEIKRTKDEVQKDFDDRISQLDQRVSDDGGRTREQLAEMRNIIQPSAEREAQIFRLVDSVTSKIDQIIVSLHGLPDRIVYHEAAGSMTNDLKELQNTLNEVCGQNQHISTTVQRHLNDFGTRLKAVEEMVTSQRTSAADWNAGQTQQGL